MGFFAIFFSVSIVVIQCTSLLLNRDAHEWTFFLMKKTPDVEYLKQVNQYLENSKNNNSHNFDRLALAMGTPHATFSYSLDDLSKFKSPQQNFSLKNKYNNVINTSIYQFDSSLSSQAQTACIQSTFQNKGNQLPTYCILNMHSREIMTNILRPINPHLLLLVLSIIHCIFCISKVKKTIWSTLVLHSKQNVMGNVQEEKMGIEHPNTISLPVNASIFYILLLVVFIIEYNRNTVLVEYTTIILALVPILSSMWFVYWHSSSLAEDHDWFVFQYLQTIVIPVAVLTFCIVGTRFWTDVLYHIVLLTCANHALYVSISSQDVVSVKLSQIICVAAPILSLYLAWIQWGGMESWKYTMGLMGSSVLLIFLFYPFFFMLDTQNHRMKLFSKISLLLCSSAIISLVVNLGMFYERPSR
jgi:hypothetical protein